MCGAGFGYELLLLLALPITLATILTIKPNLFHTKNDKSTDSVLTA